MYLPYHEIKLARAPSEYVCTVHKFIKASAAWCAPIRFALGDLHHLEEKSETFGTLWMAKDLTAPREEHRGYGVTFRHMQSKLVICQPAGSMDLAKSAWFVSYSMQSGL